MSSRNGGVAWIRFFFERWRASLRVGEMTLEERGLYLELLWLQAELGGSFEWDPERIARQLRTTVEEVERCWPKVELAFERKLDGSLNNTPMQVEVDRARNRVEKARRAGEASGRARKGRSTNQRSNVSSSGVRTTEATDAGTTQSPPSASSARRWSTKRALNLLEEEEGELAVKVWAHWVAHLDSFTSSRRPPWTTIEDQLRRFRKVGWTAAQEAVKFLIGIGKATVSEKVLQVSEQGGGDDETDRYVKELFGRGDG